MSFCTPSAKSSKGSDKKRVAGDGDMVDYREPPEAGTSSLAFDAVSRYASIVETGSTSMPVAAVEVLAEAIEGSKARTMSELIDEMNREATELKKSAANPISLSAGTALLLRFITLQRPSNSTSVRSFDAHKRELAARARDFVAVSSRCGEIIAQGAYNRIQIHRGDLLSLAEAANFIEDGARIMTHGYSRTVLRSLLHASQIQRKRFTVLVAETRPFGTGLQTHAALTNHSIPCTVILDNAVAYAMSTCDLVLLGAEGVCENGGLISGIGSFQMALAAQAFSLPVFGLAESYKFLRLYPLNQQDIPTPTRPLTATSLTPCPGVEPFRPPGRPMRDSPMPKGLNMTEDMLNDQPLLDYVLPTLIRAIVSDLSVSTPEGVADTLLSVFGGE